MKKNTNRSKKHTRQRRMGGAVRSADMIRPDEHPRKHAKVVKMLDELKARKVTTTTIAERLGIPGTAAAAQVSLFRRTPIRKSYYQGLVELYTETTGEAVKMGGPRRVKTTATGENGTTPYLNDNTAQLLVNLGGFQKKLNAITDTVERIANLEQLIADEKATLKQQYEDLGTMGGGAN